MDKEEQTEGALGQELAMTLEEKRESKTKRIICPICTSNETYQTFKKLVKHLTDHHDINIVQSSQNFVTFNEFLEWRSLENRDVDYINHSTSTYRGKKYISYRCNRSNSEGFVSTAKVRNLKTGGSIKINGMCPSKIDLTILENGNVTMTFIETHVGHENELRSKRLTGKEEKHIVDKMLAGVNSKRILNDARKIEDGQLSRMNLLNAKDLSNLKRKHNIDNRRHADDMMATALKIEEWNKLGRNYAFLFKKIGDNYPGLKEEDFAVGFMNGIMEKKMRENFKTVCVDGTHGSNRRNWELTIILVKDESGSGFPVAFLLSNRHDQIIQEIFFMALKSRLGESVEAEFIMSDDDPKYYNAWVKAMSPQNKPRRLLCSWHVVKNWTIQGRTKIKNANIKEGMKLQMRKIHQALNEEEFLENKESYFQYLEQENEIDFLNYLKKYYFKDKERMMMWAYCYRLGAGINTNMAIESLNKYLKYDKMEGQKNIRVEKLLDLLEEIVDEKMWMKIIRNERPNANNYQHKMTVEAHKKAESMKDSIENVNGQNFMVKSLYDDKYYQVQFISSCDPDCRFGYCSNCKICLHKYKCKCFTNSIKTIMCKHIHAVSMFGQRSDPVLYENSDEDNNLEIHQPSTSRINYNDDVRHFMNETVSNTRNLTSICNEEENDVEDQLSDKLKTLNLEGKKNLLAYISSMGNEMFQTQSQCQEPISKKRKIEKQTYFPRKK